MFSWTHTLQRFHVLLDTHSLVVFMFFWITLSSALHVLLNTLFSGFVFSWIHTLQWFHVLLDIHSPVFSCSLGHILSSGFHVLLAHTFQCSSCSLGLTASSGFILSWPHTLQWSHLCTCPHLLCLLWKQQCVYHVDVGNLICRVVCVSQGPGRRKARSSCNIFVEVPNPPAVKEAGFSFIYAYRTVVPSWMQWKETIQPLRTVLSAHYWYRETHV